MLTPVTPNPTTTSTSIKTHGSESRATTGHSQAEAQAVPQAAAHNAIGIGLDAGTILSNVNAEAATAGNRTILQTLALAVAAQLNIVRRNDETMDAFFLRIATAIDQMQPDEMLATEAQAGLKLLKISLPELSAALKQPESALAARLSAIAETPMATPQKTAAAVATTTYLQETSSNSRAAETLAMVTQLRSNPEGSGLFSSNTPEATRQPSDARSLQMQLKSLFEPGIAETRMEIDRKAEPAQALVPRADVELSEATPASGLAEEEAAAPQTGAALQPQSDIADPPVAAQSEQPAAEAEAGRPLASSGPVDVQQAAADAKPVDAKLADASPAEVTVAEAGPDSTSTATTDAATPEKPETASALPRPEPRVIALPLSQSNNSPSLAMRIRTIAQELAPNKTPIEDDNAVQKDIGDHRVQTLLALKGIAEVAMPAPVRAEETAADMPRGPAPKGDRADGGPMEKATLATAHLPEDGAVSDTISSAVQTARKDVPDERHAVPASLPDADDANEAVAARRETASETASIAKSSETQSGAPARTAAGNLDPVPFAYATPQPAKDEFKVKAAQDEGRQGEDDDAGEHRDREDPEARRERLARKALDDLLRPEPDDDLEVKITRDSSQADRAYALYQRMAGF